MRKLLKVKRRAQRKYSAKKQYVLCNGRHLISITCLYDHCAENAMATNQSSHFQTLSSRTHPHKPAQTRLSSIPRVAFLLSSSSATTSRPLRLAMVLKQLQPQPVFGLFAPSLLLAPTHLLLDFSCAFDHVFPHPRRPPRPMPELSRLSLPSLPSQPQLRPLSRLILQHAPLVPSQGAHISSPSPFL
jgi:hypothetical protein